MKWIAPALFLAFTVRTSGQTPQPAQLVVGTVFQKDAPVQIVGIEGNGDNALYTVRIKNATDKYVGDLMVTWTAFRPVKCAASGPAPRIQHMERWASSAHAIGVLQPHEQTEIGSCPHGVARNGPEIQCQESASAGGHRLRELQRDGRRVHQR